MKLNLVRVSGEFELTGSTVISIGLRSSPCALYAIVPQKRY